MNFEVVHCHTRTWGVELPRAVMAADTGQVLIFDLLTSLKNAWIGDGREGFRIHSRIAHHSFKRVIRMGLFELGQASLEPARRRGLKARRRVSQSPRKKFQKRSESTHSWDPLLGRVRCVNGSGLLRSRGMMLSVVFVGWRCHSASLHRWVKNPFPTSEIRQFIP